MELITFGGRAGDRNDRAMIGAQTMGTALARANGLVKSEIGSSEPPLAAAWEVELEAARPDLLNLQRAIAAALNSGKRPISTLGRCAAALGTLPTVAHARRDAAVVYFDAHGDCNTPEHTSTGYLGGMVLSGAAGCWETGLGNNLKLSNVVLVGCRDLDPFECELIDKESIKTVALGPDLPARLRTALAGRSAYVHFDCDVLDPGIVATEYRVPHGLSLQGLHEACAVIAECEVVGLEIAEFEASWADGTSCDPGPFVAALEPLFAAMKRTS
jgi:arginase